MNEDKVFGFGFMMGLACATVILFMLLITTTLKLTIDPPKYTAQDSMNLINNCFEKENNALDCYTLCRDEQWTVEHCTEVYNTFAEKNGLRTINKVYSNWSDYQNQEVHKR